MKSTDWVISSVAYSDDEKANGIFVQLTCFLLKTGRQLALFWVKTNESQVFVQTHRLDWVDWVISPNPPGYDRSSSEANVTPSRIIALSGTGLANFEGNYLKQQKEAGSLDSQKEVS